jgi:hypothetical protein
MKSFINTLAVIAILIMPFKSNACLILGDMNTLGNESFSFNSSGEFLDDMKFTLTEASYVGLSLTNVFFNGLGNEIISFGGNLSLVVDSETNSDIADLTLSTSPLTDLPSPLTGTVQVLSFGGLLGAGEYLLNITGTAPDAGASYAGNIVAVAESIAAVPVPATLWLFGSAIAGMIGLKRSKNKFAA